MVTTKIQINYMMSRKDSAPKGGGRVGEPPRLSGIKIAATPAFSRNTTKAANAPAGFATPYPPTFAKQH
jgi:hypothetical protein